LIHKNIIIILIIIVTFSVIEQHHVKNENK
jgi:hypothetical protein